MMGIFPMKVFWCCVCSCSSPSFMIVFVMSTYRGAEYLRGDKQVRVKGEQVDRVSS